MNMMSSANSWLFSDNSRYSTQARLLFMGLSFAIGILTFLLYLCVWYACTRRRYRGGSAEPEEEEGMSAAAIAALPTTTTTTLARDAGSGSGPAMECAVCLGQVEAGEKVRRMPACAHSFHADCVDAWLRARTTCPMCRAPVVVAKTDAGAARRVLVPAAAGSASASAV